MENDYTLHFIKNKLQHIKSAVMYTPNNNQAGLPNDIIEFECVDMDGLLWFTAHTPRRWMKAYGQYFPVKLIFYRKGVDYFVELDGTAVVANKEDILPNTNEVHGGKLLLKMVPYYIEYTETTKRTSLTGLRKLKGQVYDFLMTLAGFSKARQPHLSE